MTEQNPVSILIKDTPEKKQRRERHTYIGGPDAASIVGASKYGDAYDVWLRKTQGIVTEMNAAMDWGLRLERPIAEKYADVTGLQIYDVDQVYGTDQIFHSEYPFIGGSIDFLTSDPLRLVECKSASEDQIRQIDENGLPLWGDEGSEDVPLAYWVQCQLYMGISGKIFADLPVLFLGPARIFRIYTIPFHKESYDGILKLCVDFWNNHVIPGIPPEISDSPSGLVTNWLALKALSGGAIIEADEQLNAAANTLEILSRERSAIEKKEDAIKAQILSKMALEGIQKIKGRLHGAGYSINVQCGGEGKPYTDWQAVAQSLAVRCDLPGIPSDLEKTCTHTGKPRAAYIRAHFTAVRNAIKKG